MFTYRIKTLASLIDKDSSVLDVGTDHAYLPIYLVSNGLCKSAIGSDVSEKVLLSAKKNVEKFNLSNEIKLYLSDGVMAVEENYDTVVIAGMGYTTIKSIVDEISEDKKFVIQTNSDHSNLRKYMNDLGYTIFKEVVIKDKNKYYVIIKFIKGFEKLTKEQILFGKSGNVEYFKFLKNKNEQIIKQVPFKVKLKLLKENKILNKLLKENGVTNS